MNNIERKMIETLKKLSLVSNVSTIKAEFEAEATRLDEAIRLKEIVDSAEMSLLIKIGGAEAIRDMFDAQLLDVSGLVAPMIESSYALKKYLDAIDTFFPNELKTRINFGINIETIQAYKNLKEILSTKGVRKLKSITVGRVDLASSMGLTRYDVNSTKVYETTEDILNKAKHMGLETTVGGGIAIEAIPFIKQLTAKNLLDRYETRKVVFPIQKSFNKIKQGILLANEFELMWLENKKNYYSSIYREDDKRIAMLKVRLRAGKNHH
jgi:hypothetical protein